MFGLVRFLLGDIGISGKSQAAKHKMRDRATGGRRKPQQWQKVKADILRFPKWYDTWKLVHWFKS